MHDWHAKISEKTLYHIANDIQAIPHICTMHNSHFYQLHKTLVCSPLMLPIKDMIKETRKFGKTGNYFHTFRYCNSNLSDCAPGA